MPTSSFSALPRRPAAFLDRVDESRVVQEHVELLASDPTHLKVFAVTGLGGVGKTRFLGELRGKVTSLNDNTILIWVSLESEAAATATGPLRVMRNQLPFDCMLFDSALLSYWSATGQPFQNVGGRGRGASFAMRAVELGGGVSGLPLPLTFAADLYEGVARSITRRHRYNRLEFQTIDEFRHEPSKLYARLPHYLALDVQRRTTTRRRFICFYDAYEKQSPETLARAAPWLREFIATLGSGVHVISTRDRLAWDPAQWSGVLQAVDLGELPTEYCREMIRAELGEIGDEIEDVILSASHQLPFFVEAAIDICRAHLDKRGRIVATDLPTSPDAVVDHLIDHLDSAERILAVALAVLEYFDDTLYSYLVRALNLRLDVVDIGEFTEWFFVQPSHRELYKTHDLLTECVRKSSRLQTIALRALDAATESLALRLSHSGFDDVERLLQLYHSALSGWQSVDAVPMKSLEALIDVGYQFYDAGYWQGLTESPVKSTSPNVADFPSLFFRALATRRTAGARRALMLLEPLESLRKSVGRHAASFDLEVAYLSEITGNYARARAEFASLYRQRPIFDPNRRDHVRSRLYYADMLVMDGEFVDASRILLDGYETIGPRSQVDWAEYVRHRGHAHRFALLFEEAERLYLQALQAVEDFPSMRGKLYTNLVETRCWLAPAAALRDSEVAMRVNGDIGNRLEVAKCETATAIALAQIGDTNSARELSVRSQRHFHGVEYPAGIAFALQARVMVEVAADAPEQADKAYSLLVSVVEQLGTYGHLCVGPASLRGDANEVHRGAENVSWLGTSDLEQRLSRLRIPTP